jgi:hypothetical protein
VRISVVEQISGGRIVMNAAPSGSSRSVRPRTVTGSEPIRLAMPRWPHVHWLPGGAWVGETANPGNASILAVRIGHDADCGLATILPDDRLWLPSLSHSGR